MKFKPCEEKGGGAFQMEKPQFDSSANPHDKKMQCL